MKNILWLCLVAVILAGCSSKPSESEIKREIFGDNDNDIVQYDNFEKVDGIKKDEITYIADVKYSVKFKLGAKEMSEAADKESRFGFFALLPLVSTFGTIPDKGFTYILTRKVTLIKKESGWTVESMTDPEAQRIVTKEEKAAALKKSQYEEEKKVAEAKAIEEKRVAEAKAIEEKRVAEEKAIAEKERVHVLADNYLKRFNEHILGAYASDYNLSPSKFDLKDIDSNCKLSTILLISKVTIENMLVKVAIIATNASNNSRLVYQADDINIPLAVEAPYQSEDIKKFIISGTLSDSSKSLNIKLGLDSNSNSVDYCMKFFRADLENLPLILKSFNHCTNVEHARRLSAVAGSSRGAEGGTDSFNAWAAILLDQNSKNNDQDNAEWSNAKSIDSLESYNAYLNGQLNYLHRAEAKNTLVAIRDRVESLSKIPLFTYMSTIAMHAKLPYFLKNPLPSKFIETWAAISNCNSFLHDTNGVEQSLFKQQVENEIRNAHPSQRFRFSKQMTLKSYDPFNKSFVLGDCESGSGPALDKGRELKGVKLVFTTDGACTKTLNRQQTDTTISIDRPLSSNSLFYMDTTDAQVLADRLSHMPRFCARYQNVISDIFVDFVADLSPDFNPESYSVKAKLIAAYIWVDFTRTELLGILGNAKKGSAFK